MTEKDTQFGEVGSRPRISRMCSYSSGVMPCSLMTSGVISGSASVTAGALARRHQLKWSHRIVGSHVPGNRSAAR